MFTRGYMYRPVIAWQVLSQIQLTPPADSPNSGSVSVTLQRTPSSVESLGMAGGTGEIWTWGSPVMCVGLYHEYYSDKML